jgi:predicted RNA-binding Zn ribbon-like protein
MAATQGRSAGSEPAIGRAPGELARLQAFVNTLDIEEGTDDLSTPAALDRWLRDAGLAAAGAARAGPRDLAIALDLREALRGVLRSHVTHKAARRLAPAEALVAAGKLDAEADAAGAGGADAAGAGGTDAIPADADAAARLAVIAATMRAELHADAAGRVAVAPAGAGASASLTRLLLIAAESATVGTWPRLKVCSADDCQWAFYDRSPTRSGCWCSMQICGSRAKARAYRSRAAR